MRSRREGSPRRPHPLRRRGRRRLAYGNDVDEVSQFLRRKIFRTAAGAVCAHFIAVREAAVLQQRCAVGVDKLQLGDPHPTALVLLKLANVPLGKQRRIVNFGCHDHLRPPSRHVCPLEPLRRAPLQTRHTDPLRFDDCLCACWRAVEEVHSPDRRDTAGVVGGDVDLEPYGVHTRIANKGDVQLVL